MSTIRLITTGPYPGTIFIHSVWPLNGGPMTRVSTTPLFGALPTSDDHHHAWRPWRKSGEHGYWLVTTEDGYNRWSVGGVLDFHAQPSESEGKPFLDGQPQVFDGSDFYWFGHKLYRLPASGSFTVPTWDPQRVNPVPNNNPNPWRICHGKLCWPALDSFGNLIAENFDIVEKANETSVIEINEFVVIEIDSSTLHQKLEEGGSSPPVGTTAIVCRAGEKATYAVGAGEVIYIGDRAGATAAAEAP